MDAIIFLTNTSIYMPLNYFNYLSIYFIKSLNNLFFIVLQYGLLLHIILIFDTM